MKKYNILLEENKNKILVIGDIMLDNYIFGVCNRISPEAPVPILEITREKKMLGGAGNVLNNVTAFGIQCDIITVVGDDLEGENIINLVDSNKLSTKDGIFIDKTRKTTVKKRLISSSQQLLRIDTETNHEINEESEKKIIDFFITKKQDYKIVLISDYNKGVITESLCKKIINVCNENDICVMVDPKGKDFSKYSNVNLIKPNLNELEIAIKESEIKLSELEKIANNLKSQLNIKKIVVTLGEDGIFLSDNRSEIIPTKANKVYDVSGAGDTVLASIAVCMLNDFSLFDSCNFANSAASIIIQKFGAETTTVKEVILELK